MATVLLDWWRRYPRAAADVVDEIKTIGGWTAGRYWCGFTYGAAWLRCGLLPIYKNDMYHTLNAAAFFSQGTRGTRNRFDPGQVSPGREYVNLRGLTRPQRIALLTAKASIGDMLCFGSPTVTSGQYREGEHITTFIRLLPDGRVVTLEGNGSGKTSDGKSKTSAMVVDVYDAGDTKILWLGVMGPADVGLSQSDTLMSQGV